MRPKPHLARRTLACLIDYTIIYTISFFMIIWLGAPDDEGVYSLNGAPALLPILLWLFMMVATEVYFGGTLGNSIAGIKAIPEDGPVRNLTIAESFKRHILDPIDMFFFGLVAIIVIKNTVKNQRVGDLWAKTVVVKMSRLQ